MSPLTISLLVLLFVALLLVVAVQAERSTPLALRLSRSPVTYALSLAVYCTSWTYYGSVGRAATSGLSFLAIYIGPTITICLWWVLLRRMVLIKEKYRITSIADFISARFGKSKLVAALVTAIAIVGNMPYIALQLKAIKDSFSLVIDAGAPAGTWLIDQFGPVIVVVMTLFTVVFGARKLDPTERHRGMIAVVALESLVKLLAFLVCGIYVTYFLSNGFTDLLGSQATGNSEIARVFSIGGDEGAYVEWMTLLVLSMAAIICLPRQFHVAVVENPSERTILPAMWLFPLYMVLINIFVIPIAVYGIRSGIPVTQADTYVLRIPLQHGDTWIAALVFIGGFSAATGMIMIAAMTMSTMVVNHLLLPLFSAVSFLAPMRRQLLKWRWAGITAILSLGYWFETKLGDSYALVNMGLISFAAVVQFAPATLGALFWPKGSRAGALAGLAGGFSLWLYTLLLPAFSRSGWLDPSFLDNGPWGFGLLRPEHLFGMTSLSPLSHSVFWSLFCNAGLFVLVSIFCRRSQEEERLAQEFHAVTDREPVPCVDAADEATIAIGEKQAALLAVLGEYFPEVKCREMLGEIITAMDLSRRKTISVIEYAEFIRQVEAKLAGSVGSAMAHQALNSETIFTAGERARLAGAYADILLRLHISPRELNEKIDFYREREQLLTNHSRELEQRIDDKEREIAARVVAEKALAAAEQKYRSIFDNALEGIFQISPEGSLLIANPALANILGYDSAAKLVDAAKDVRTLFRGRRRLREMLFRQLQAGRRVENFQIRAVHAGGRIIWLNINARPIFDEQGELLLIEGIAEDISMRKEAEDTLARYHVELEAKVRARTAEVVEKQAFLEQILEGILAAVIVVDHNRSRVMQCNRIAEELLGCGKEQMLVDGDSPKHLEPIFSDLDRKTLNREMVLQRVDGATIPILRNILPVVYKGGPAYAVILFDISEHKALERQVSMAQKLQSIGQLAAGVAHEINTPIQYIGSNLSFLSESFQQLMQMYLYHRDAVSAVKDGGDINELCRDFAQKTEELDLEFLSQEVPQALSESLAGVGQVSAIVKAMKQFAQPEEDNPTAVDINKALEQTIVVSRNEWKYAADMEMQFDPANPVITGYPGPLNQVFLDMIVNAARAIAEKKGESGGKGRIVISTAGGERGVTVTIADNGGGIAQENLQKIFDPFFTTRAVGKGIGQGLNIAHTVITDKHHGSIQVESTMGVGTTFTINLPLHSDGHDGEGDRP